MVPPPPGFLALGLSVNGVVITISSLPLGSYLPGLPMGVTGTGFITRPQCKVFSCVIGFIFAAFSRFGCNRHVWLNASAISRLYSSSFCRMVRRFSLAIFSSLRRALPRCWADSFLSKTLFRSRWVFASRSRTSLSVQKAMNVSPQSGHSKYVISRKPRCFLTLGSALNILLQVEQVVFMPRPSRMACNSPGRSSVPGSARRRGHDHLPSSACLHPARPPFHPKRSRSSL